MKESELKENWKVSGVKESVMTSWGRKEEWKIRDKGKLYAGEASSET